MFSDGPFYVNVNELICKIGLIKDIDESVDDFQGELLMVEKSVNVFFEL